MTDSQTETVDQLILGRLDEADLPEAATDLALAALLGHDDLAATLGEAVPIRRQVGVSRPCKPWSVTSGHIDDGEACRFVRTSANDKRSLRCVPEQLPMAKGVKDAASTQRVPG